MNNGLADGESDVAGYNIRKSLAPAQRPTNVDKPNPSKNAQRKTLISSKSEDYPAEYSGSNGFQNSHFDLRNVENKLAHLAQIHLVLEHLLLIQTTLNLENGTYFFRPVLVNTEKFKQTFPFRSLLNVFG